MRIKILTFRYSTTLSAFDASALDELTRDKEILGFREHFWTHNDVPHLACVVLYQDTLIDPGTLHLAGAARESLDGPSLERIALREAAHEAAKERQERATSALSEADRVLWGTIREWRARTARAEGAPADVILTNKLLTEIVVRKPTSLAALGNIPRFGPMKVERYGRAILALLHGRHDTFAPGSQGEGRVDKAPREDVQA